MPERIYSKNKVRVFKKFISEHYPWHAVTFELYTLGVRYKIYDILNYKPPNSFDMSYKKKENRQTEKNVNACSIDQDKLGWLLPIEIAFFVDKQVMCEVILQRC